MIPFNPAFCLRAPSSYHRYAQFIAGPTKMAFRFKDPCQQFIVIRQHEGLRPSNHLWWLPSNCTNSPKCSRLSRRLRYSPAWRSPFQSPLDIRCLRNALTLIFMPSFSFIFSDAKVGPKSLYFSRYASIAFSTIRSSGRLFEGLP